MFSPTPKPTVLEYTLARSSYRQPTDRLPANSQKDMCLRLASLSALNLLSDLVLQRLSKQRRKQAKHTTDGLVHKGPYSVSRPVIHAKHIVQARVFWKINTNPCSQDIIPDEKFFSEILVVSIRLNAVHTRKSIHV